MAVPADLARRAEEACLNGWPALRQVWFDGWLLRFSDGHTRRSNSVTPLQAGSRDVRAKLAYCEALYAAARLPPIFRVLSFAEPKLDAALDSLGYDAAEDETCVIYRDLRDRAAEPADAEIVEGRPSEEWLDAHARCTGSAAKARNAQLRILEALALPAVFAGVRAPDRSLVSLAFGAVHDRILCVNLVVTDAAFRKQGWSRRAVSAVLAWAQERHGAEGACLPVVAANAPAVALYRSLGFDAELHRYHYRRHRFPRA